MTTKELIQTKLDTLSEDNLKELYILIQHIAKNKPSPQSLMEKLQQIHIDAPADFSTNFLKGKKRQLGTATGLFTLSEDFDEPLEDFKGYQ